MTHEDVAALVDGIAPVVRDYATEAVQDVTTRLTVVEAQASRLLRAEAALDALTGLVGAVRERLAIVETRPPLPGPAGDPGPAGKDGADGQDGKAGLTYLGVYQEGKAYDPGEIVTWAGSCWHCNEAATATKPGDGLKAWTLMVKRGRDGKGA